eukprot:CAMPEP_0204846046 /NCGR_PEP_ID=MMETSP1347-20130617/1690_1 /ASSEMBLY_ACC=CAM_ASM_000690 /TAXON_ID=215587 /ORGANISM="Aplanochytrium stocchinoi, Strain GSBS06" /LENGTH=196 /DNA_ID=CAMNT_0051986437 /DNA_START=43 /DNA_END=633 /DNA_ORIENTATION=-
MAGREFLGDVYCVINSAVEEWHVLTTEGLKLASAVSNTFIQNGHLDGLSWGILQNNTYLQSLVLSKTRLKRLQQVKQLQQVLTRLVGVCKSVNEFRSCLEKVEFRLDFAANDNANATTTPLVKTCTFEDVSDYLAEFESMLSKDVKVKESVVLDLSLKDSFDREELLVYLSAWSTSPFLDTQRIDELLRILNNELE